MPLILGIDTGGTYTDGVLLDLKDKKLKTKAKAFTTREDLSLGIRQCIDNMTDLNSGEIAAVVLSTTLATNAIVEGRGCRVGLILIGREPDGTYPAQKVVVVKGGHNIKGQPLGPLDTDGVRRAVEQLRGTVDTIAISGYLSIRNPEHEKLAQNIVAGMWNVPIVCAHQLTTALGFYERTVTACLNARLLTVVAELLEAVKQVLKEKEIAAKILVVKGDGSLMSEEFTREKPIETILSGPAASIVGATFLTGVKNALILDMGGTTSDIAILEKGWPRLNPEGATVGGWKTRVHAAEISTFGHGGDSYLQVDKDGKLKVGPERVWPLSVVAASFPYLIQELSEVDARCEVLTGQPGDCWILVKRPEGDQGLSERELTIIAALKDGPHSVFVLAEIVGIDVNILPLKRLEQAQIIGRISFTPTDLLHCMGKFTAWSIEAALAGARIQAERTETNPEEFLRFAFQTVKKNLCVAVLQSLAYRQGLSLNLSSDQSAAFFLQTFLDRENPFGFRSKLFLDYPIVAIGAPVAAYLPEVAKAFNTEVLIPEHAEVANAVGAAAGQITEKVKALVKPGAEGGFVIHAPWGIEAFVSLKEAKAHAVEKARSIALQNASKSGAFNPQVAVEEEELVGHTREAGEVFVEAQIEATATGRPNWGERYNAS